MEKNNDTIVQELFKIVQKKKEEISKAEKPSWKTNCSFRFDDTSRSLNLNTVLKVEPIIEAYTFLLNLSNNWEKAVVELDLNIDENKFTWCGYSVDDWKTDFKTRINKIQITTKKKELEFYETRLNKLVSKEMRDRMELEELTKLLNK